MQAATNWGAVADLLVAQGKREIAKKAAENRARPIGEIRLDVGFYSKAELKRRSGERAWAVWRVRWDGSYWRNVRRISGPMNCPDALHRLTAECKRLGLERTP